MATIASAGKIETYLGAKAESLLGFKSPKIPKERDGCVELLNFADLSPQIAFPVGAKVSRLFCS